MAGKSWREPGARWRRGAIMPHDPNGDLLYVGVTLELSSRQKKHVAEAKWRHMIFKILCEPFASREEALAAETRAIWDEFPKFNMIHNGQRHPMQELRVAKEQARC